MALLPDGQHRERLFDAVLRDFIAAPEQCATPRSRLLFDLIRGWGNPDWGAREEFLAECVSRALNARGPILECGTGLSTVLVAAIARRRGLAHWALEHMPQWAARVEDTCRRYDLDTLVVSTAPLKDYGDYCWYEPPLAAMPARFALVICDGPPGETKGGRYGMAPVMRGRLAAGCDILLDDGGRIHERVIAWRWSAELGTSLKLLGSRKPFIAMTVTAKRA